MYMETGGDRSFPSGRREGEDREGGSRWKTVLCIVLGDCLAASSVLNLEVTDNPIPKSSESIQLRKPELDSCVEFPVKVPATKVGKSKQGEGEVHSSPQGSTVLLSTATAQTFPGRSPPAASTCS